MTQLKIKQQKITKKIINRKAKDYKKSDKRT